MRVIAGTARGHRLATVPGAGTRPITDRAKEALFAILQYDVVDARFLDLFAGTGSVGIEALSRGARRAVLVERDSQAVEVIRGNLAHTKLADKAVVVPADVFGFLAGSQPEPYDIVYVAPPQYEGLWRRTLEALDTHPAWLAADGRLVVQIHPREESGGVGTWDHFRLEDRRDYGGVRILFFRRPAGQLRPSGGTEGPAREQ